MIGFLWLIGFTRADVDSVHVAPATQTAISGSTVTFTVTGHNGTGVAYLKYVLPQTASYMLMYQSANITPFNDGYMNPLNPDPIFSLAANSNYSVTITAKLVMLSSSRSFSSITPTAIFSNSSLFTTTFPLSGTAQLTPIGDVTIKNILTGQNPSASWDIVSYAITLQNIWSALATGISFMSDFPIALFYNTPVASFNNGSTRLSYSYIDYWLPAFVWTGLGNLNPGEIRNVLLRISMKQNASVGTTFNNIAKVTSTSTEYSTTNNTATATGIVQLPANVRVTKTLAPFTGFHAGDKVVYTITYGNNGGKTAENVVITDSMNGNVSLPTTNFAIGSLPAGSGGTITLTGTFNAALASGYTFVNTATISTTSSETVTGNNTALATGIVQGRESVYVTVNANNLTRPQLDNAPYGSGTSSMIQAYSGDLVQITITYGNSGNTVGTNANLYVSGLNSFVTVWSFNGTLNTLDIDETGTITFTGIVGPQNYLGFTITPRITYNTTQTMMSNTVRIVEPIICGDGVLTRNEPCDTQGNLWVLYSGQVCENQQGMCILRTNAIINLAHITYQYPNPAWWYFTGEAWSSVNIPITGSTCTTMRGTAPVTTNDGYEITYTCAGSNTTTTTPITIDCGNGTNVSWLWSSLVGTCEYDEWFVGHAQCTVGSNACTPVAASPNAGLCEDLTSLEWSVLIVNEEEGQAKGNFRCETTNGVEATITIDCGNEEEYTSDEPTDIFEHLCTYDDKDTYNVECRVDDATSDACQEEIVVDEGLLGDCGNWDREWYEECDDGNNNDNDACSNVCTLNDNIINEPGCFNVSNMNISIQKWEILPFRWTLENKKNITNATSCNNQTDGTILQNSIMCTFKVYNGESDNEEDPINPPVSMPCSWDNRNGKALFDYFLDKQDDMRSLENAFGKYYLDSNDFDSDILGEHKLVLDKVEYTYCDGENKEHKTAVGSICSVNFAVTQPYLAQRSTFGITPKATNIKLEWYQTINGEDLISTTDLEDIMVLDESEYDGGSDVDALMTSFINKYERLAITVPQSSLKWTAFEGYDDITVKVVPQQKIYILEADDAWTAITLKDLKKFTTPFTIVTKNIDLIIKGNVEYNGMFLVKNGTIMFDKSDASAGGDRCPAPQVIKGIFVTDEGFVGRTPALKNDDLTLNRCTYGNLQVKGILIGNGVENIVESRRSHLNQWFSKAGSDPTIKAARRNDIFNGAALLIEYSPSLWSALPPGASEFTKVLDIYKQ